MAITLSDLNDQLQEQNKISNEQTDVLSKLDQSFSSVSGSLKAFIDLNETNKLKERERQLEQRQEDSKPDTKVQVKEGKSGGGLFGGNLMDALRSGGLFGLGAALAAALPGFLLKRGLPAVLASLFADEIAKYAADATGSKELGDAIYRGLGLGSLGLLISRRLGVIGFLVGAVMDEENSQKINELGENAAEIADKFAQLFGIDLPNWTDATKAVTTTIGNALDAANATLTGDFDSPEFQENIDDLLLSIGGFSLLFKRVRSKLFNLSKKLLMFNTAANKTLPPDEKIKTAGPMTRESMFSEAAKRSDKQLEKAGLQRTAKGGIQRVGGGIVSDAQLKDLLSTTTKFPRLNKLFGLAKRIPGVGALLAGGELLSILYGDGSTQDKIAGGAGILGGLGGSALGAIAGATVGSVVPVAGTAIGGLLGGAGGYFFGESVAKGLMEWLLGQKVSAFPEYINDLINGGGAQAPGTAGAPVAYDDGPLRRLRNPSPDLSSPTPVLAGMLSDETTIRDSIANKTSPIIIQDSSTKIGGSTTNHGLVMRTTVFDQYDPYSGTRTA